MNTEEPNSTTTDPASIVDITTTGASTTPMAPSTPVVSIATSSPTESDIKLDIILPSIIAPVGVIIIVLVILCICCRKRQGNRQRKEKSPPPLPSLTVPDFNHEPSETSSIGSPQEAIQPSTPKPSTPRPIKPSPKPIKPIIPKPRMNIPVKTELEIRESVASVNSAYSDGYVVPCSGPIIENQDDSYYIDMTLPNPCGVKSKGYVNDPRNPQTNLSTIDETFSPYQNTGNSVVHMEPMETVHEYANIQNLSEVTEQRKSDLYVNLNDSLDMNNLEDYENAPAKVSSNDVNTSDNLTKIIKRDKPHPSPRNNRPKLSPRSIPTDTPNHSPQGSPCAKSSPRVNPEKYRGVKVM